MCHLCEMGNRIADCIKTTDIGPVDALHVLTAALANIVRSGDWDQSLEEVVVDVNHQLRHIVGLPMLKGDGLTLH